MYFFTMASCFSLHPAGYDYVLTSAQVLKTLLRILHSSPRLIKDTLLPALVLNIGIDKLKVKPCSFLWVKGHD